MSTSTPIKIRPATSSDASALSTLATRTFLAAYGHLLTAKDANTFVKKYYDPTALEKEITDPEKDIYLSCSSSNGEEVLTGYAQLTRGTTEDCLDRYKPVESLIQLERHYVAPEEQGKGIGTALLGFAEEVARKEGKKYVWLGVWEGAVWAHRVYIKDGFEKVGERGFRIGEKGFTDWVMVKEFK